MSKVKGELAIISSKHKSIHAPISKMGKIIDKNFESSDFNPGIGLEIHIDKANFTNIILYTIVYELGLDWA